MVRFQPYSMAVQTRFKWRHKETDRWRRLMDATCFQVDWLSQTLGPNMSQHSGNWTHILTCAHVICPWNYPNFYPPQGPTRYVSHITLADTMTQIRLTSLQGNIVHKHFTSNHSVFVHTNPRLDLCVVHPEQYLNRSGENKMMWMQNEGLLIRPRLEINDELEVGDFVWIYGLTAHESLFDEEKSPEPLMVPTGVRAKVHAKTREHFFIDTTSLEGDEKGKISMGMCGSVIMRNGRCVGMLTATVHEESSCKELAGTAMCTYSSDIFEFLLEVEKQMKNPSASSHKDESIFEKRRRAEGKPFAESKDWNLDLTRVARHVEVPQSLFHMEQSWMTEEDAMTSQVFGRTGVFNQETQENCLGYDMNTAKTNGERPGDAEVFSTVHKGGKPVSSGERRDDSPVGIYAPPEDFKSHDQWNNKSMDDVREMFNEAASDPREASLLDALRRNLENTQAQKEMKQMKETVFKHTGKNAGASDPLNVGNAGHYGGDVSRGYANFSEEAQEEDEKYRRSQFTGGYGFETAREEHSNVDGDAARSDAHDSCHRQSPAKSHKELERERRRMEKLEKEKKYQEELRKRHGKAGLEKSNEDLTGLWNRH